MFYEFSKITWVSEGKTISIAEMHTDHIIRALGWLESRADSAKRIAGKVPAIFQPELFALNGRTFDEWEKILLAALNARAAEKTAERRKELEKQLAELESPEAKIARLKSELEQLA